VKQHAIHQYLRNLARRYPVQGLEESTVTP